MLIPFTANLYQILRQDRTQSPLDHAKTAVYSGVYCGSANSSDSHWLQRCLKREWSFCLPEHNRMQLAGKPKVWSSTQNRFHTFQVLKVIDRMLHQTLGAHLFQLCVQFQQLWYVRYQFLSKEKLVLEGECGGGGSMVKPGSHGLPNQVSKVQLTTSRQLIKAKNGAVAIKLEVTLKHLIR